MTRTDFPTNSIRLCFRTRNEDQCEGVMYGVALADAIEFTSIIDLILKVDNAFNRIGNPQPHQVLRSFAEQDAYCSYHGSPEKYHSSEEIAAMCGESGTFDLVMVTRKKAEWQGILKDAGNGRTEHFQTTLECVQKLLS